MITLPIGITLRLSLSSFNILLADAIVEVFSIEGITLSVGRRVHHLLLLDFITRRVVPSEFMKLHGLLFELCHALVVYIGRTLQLVSLAYEMGDALLISRIVLMTQLGRVRLTLLLVEQATRAHVRLLVIIKRALLRLRVVDNLKALSRC